jgi:hypothetical protein
VTHFSGNAGQNNAEKNEKGEGEIMRKMEKKDREKVRR